MRYRNTTKIATLVPRVTMLDSQTTPALDPMKRTLAIYGSAVWKALRARLIKERGSVCQDCGKRGRVILDHVMELRDGGAPFDPANLVFRCDRCHGAKTAATAMARAARRS